jgi:hypothetical protein
MSLRLEYLHKPKLKRPLMVAGLPGIANVGKLAVEFLIHQLRAEKFLELHSEHLPEWAIPEAGEIRTLKMDFFHVKPDGLKYDLILLTGDAQAATPRGQYALTGEILNIAEEHKVATVATMAAYVLSAHEMRRRPVVGVASSPKWTRVMREKGINLLDSGVIVGMNGMLPAFAALREMDGFCLLGTTRGGLIDPGASGAVLRALSSITGFPIDTRELVKHAEHLKSRLTRPQPRERPEEEIWYIR